MQLGLKVIKQDTITQQNGMNCINYSIARSLMLLMAAHLQFGAIKVQFVCIPVLQTNIGVRMAH